MGYKSDIYNLLMTINKCFPEVRQRINQIDQSLATMRLERFALMTDEAIQQQLFVQAQAYLDFMEQCLSNASPALCNFIDVYYAEIILYSLNDSNKKLGWQMMPSQLRQLHQGFWGTNKPYMH